jgi:hypothetical protein
MSEVERRQIKKVDELEGLLQGLSVEHRATLLHWLTCDLCAGEAALEIAGRDGGKLFLREKHSPQGSVLETFQSRSWPEWLAEAEDSGMPEAFRLALRASRELQLQDPVESGLIAFGVLEERERLRGLSEGPAIGFEAMSLVINSARLGGYGDRLRRRLDAAAEDLDSLESKVVSRVSGSAEGMYRRARGLLLWETARVPQAQALEQLDLAQAAFGAGSEEGATLLLSGLVLVEEARTEEAVFALMAGLGRMAKGERPDLEVRGLLSLACACCRAGRPDLGGAHLKHVRRSYRHEAMELDHVWGQGKVLAALKETGEAIALLTEARDRMIEAARPGEAALVTLDLTYALVTAGEKKKAEQEVAKLAAECDPEERWMSSGGWFESAVSSTWEEWWIERETGLVISVRDEGPGLKPLPFV